MIKYIFENRNIRKGFTMVELLVVISIIGLLSSVVLASTNEAREKAQYAKAQAELRQIVNSIAQLESDTGLSIGKNIIGSCQEDDNEASSLPVFPGNTAYFDDGAEFPISDSHKGVNFSGFAGIVANDGGYSNWDGPYLSSVPVDPWGRSYWFDPDYRCVPTNPANDKAVGCELYDQPGVAYRVVYSRGPTTNLSNDSDYGADNVVYVLCRNTCQFDVNGVETGGCND